MQNFFISDLHLGHRNILKYAGTTRPGLTVAEHDQALVRIWNETVPKKRSIVWLLGDVAFAKQSMDLLKELNGRVRVILGNHDLEHTRLEDFPPHWEIEPRGLVKWHEFWLSHCPIHPLEMRGRRANIHGHVHANSVPDPRYVNVCVENLPGCRPRTLDSIREELDGTAP